MPTVLFDSWKPYAGVSVANCLVANPVPPFQWSVSIHERLSWVVFWLTSSIPTRLRSSQTSSQTLSPSRRTASHNSSRTRWNTCEPSKERRDEEKTARGYFSEKIKYVIFTQAKTKSCRHLIYIIFIHLPAITPTCFKQRYGMFHGGNSELSQSELL